MLAVTAFVVSFYSSPTHGPPVHYVDADGDGAYSLDELMAASEKLGCTCLLSSTCIGNNADTLLPDTSHSGYAAEMREKFARHDANGDGVLSREEADNHYGETPNLIKITQQHCMSHSRVELREPAHWDAERPNEVRRLSEGMSLDVGSNPLCGRRLQSDPTANFSSTSVSCSVCPKVMGCLAGDADNLPLPLSN